MRVVALVIASAFTASALTGDHDLGRTHKTTDSRVRRWWQVGQASWYGPRFQGHKTAAGEHFDMNRLTCAHPSLPLGSWIRVTNLRNRKSVFVRVNDRGPFVDGRIVDLSYAAAQAVGLTSVGKVKLETVAAGDPEIARALLAQLQLPTLASFPQLP